MTQYILTEDQLADLIEESLKYRAVREYGAYAQFPSESDIQEGLDLYEQL